MSRQATSTDGHNIDRDRLVDLYRTMRRIRAFEEAAEKASITGQVGGAVHLSIGQEAIAAGVCANLRQTDQITTTHRGHGHCIAKGTDPGAMMLELFGKEGGTCGGKGGSMHIADFEVGMLGANGVVAAGLPIAVGAAHGAKLMGEDRVVVCFFGDGAINRRCCGDAERAGHGMGCMGTPRGQIDRADVAVIHWCGQQANLRDHLFRYITETHAEARFKANCLDASKQRLIGIDGVAALITGQAHVCRADQHHWRSSVHQGDFNALDIFDDLACR